MRLPSLPKSRTWHPLAVSFWETIGTSPTMTHWTPVDVSALLVLVSAYDDFWTATSSWRRLRLSSVITRLSVRLGLTPLGRRRLGIRVPRARKPADVLPFRSRTKSDAS